MFFTGFLQYIACLAREIKDFYAFYRQDRSSPFRRIVIYVEKSSYFAYLEGLAKKLSTQYGYSISYVTSDAADKRLVNHIPNMRAFYIRELLPLFMAFIDCRVMIMTLTELDKLHIKRSVNPVHYVYSFHAMVSTHMMYTEGAFDGYDSILCVGPHHIEEIRKRESLNKLPPKHLVEGGYYRLERIHASCRNLPAKDSKNRSKTTVLIAPSWGENNLLASCGERITEILLKNNYRVIIRPHPETIKRSPGLIAAFKEAYGINPDFTLETSTATDESLLLADIMICDCSGVALEYAFGTERPVLFLDSPIKIKNLNYQSLGLEPLELSLRHKIGKLWPPEKLDQLPEVLESLLIRKDEYRTHIVNLREQVVFAFGRSSDTGAEWVHRLARSG